VADETSDAVTREAAWLAQSYDSLPALLKSAGGRWDVVQGYWPGDGLARGKSGIYVTRARVDDDHPSAWRYRPRHIFRLKLIWPIEAAAISPAENESRLAEAESPPAEEERSPAETAQQDFDNAIGDLLVRIRGPQGDKTHGGRFLSVAEVPSEGSVSVVFDDPEITIRAANQLRATVTYYADDSEFSG
jgi:hypothetical protein